MAVVMTLQQPGSRVPTEEYYGLFPNQINAVAGSVRSFELAYSPTPTTIGQAQLQHVKRRQFLRRQGSFTVRRVSLQTWSGSRLPYALLSGGHHVDPHRVQVSRDEEGCRLRSVAGSGAIAMAQHVGEPFQHTRSSREGPNCSSSGNRRRRTDLYMWDKLGPVGKACTLGIRSAEPHDRTASTFSTSIQLLAESEQLRNPSGVVCPTATITLLQGQFILATADISHTC
ncbi:hypothetical protein IAQ61_002704 [Plenodomus lingam]|uniref:uncharacterized protein n=1 Tax=Leptosphaeria maculans TaxID=5022 RepID=UPI00331F8B96|nr:hypothetical protein IAQ61_002704 [Plenodomus lingam]